MRSEAMEMGSMKYLLLFAIVAHALLQSTFGEEAEGSRREQVTRPLAIRCLSYVFENPFRDIWR